MPNIVEKIRNNPTYADQLRHWRVMTLALSAFIFNTTEFIPIALLSDIGKSFAMSVADVGFMMTLYAWIVAVMSVPAMLMTANIERRTLLMWLFALFIGGHLVSIFASHFWVLLIGRGVIALAHAVFWSITASLAVRVAPKGKQAKALGVVAVGSAMATVLGLPLGRVIGQMLGWRMTFAVIALLALLAMVILWKILPKLPSKNAGSLASLPSIVKNKPLLIIYILTVLAVTAHFTAYSYVEPYAVQLAGFSDSFATGILLVFGVAGFVASGLFSRFYEKFPNKFLLLSLLALGLALVLLGFIANHAYFWVMLALVWGVAITAISLALQLRVLKLAPNATDLAMSIFSGIYNVGIGGGALLGSVVIGLIGLNFVGFVGSAVLMLAILLCLGFLRYRS